MFAALTKRIKDLFWPSTITSARKILAIPEDTDYNPMVHLECVKEALRHLDINEFVGVTTRDLMGVQLPLRQKRFELLTDLMSSCTTAIAHEEDTQLDKLMKRNRSSGYTMELDRFFFSPIDGQANIAKAIKELRYLVQANYGTITQFESSYYPRMMTLVYYDIRVLLIALMDIVESKEPA